MVDPGMAAAAMPTRPPLSVVESPASETTRRRIRWVIVVSAILFAALAPFAALRLPAVPAFIPSMQFASGLLDLLTASLIFSQLPRVRSSALAVLGGAYVFSAAMALFHGLSFPGAFAPTGLVGGGTQTTPWLWAMWHAGFPLGVVLYAGLRGRAGEPAVRHVARAGALAALAAVGVAGLCLAIASAGHPWLPRTLVDGAYTPILYVVNGAVWAIVAGALALLWRRRARSALDYWLLAVMVAWLFDVTLNSAFNAGRYDLGFYAGRVFGLLAMSVVLCILLAEMAGMHRRLEAALVRAEDANRALAAAQEQLARVQRLEAMGQLTGGLAHDFNNLLTVVSGSLEMVLEDPKDVDRNVRVSEIALEAVRRGRTLIRQLLTFARRDVLHPAVVALPRHLDELGHLLAQAASPAAELDLRTEADVGAVRVDVAQFEMALLNLVINARDAMAGGGTIAIGVEPASVTGADGLPVSPGRYAAIRVTDRGGGMSPEVAARAFEPFFTTKPPGQGSGLGLSQVYGFARGADGHVVIDSALGRGTTVTILLPLCPAEGAAVPSATPEVAGA